MAAESNTSIKGENPALQVFKDELSLYAKKVNLPKIDEVFFCKCFGMYRNIHQGDGQDFISRVERRIERRRAKVSDDLAKQEYWDEVQYRVIRIFDEIFKQRHCLYSLIDDWHDKGTLSVDDVIELIAFTQNALSSTHPVTPDRESLISFFEEEQMNTLSVAFAERLISLNKKNGIHISKNSIELFTRLFDFIEVMDVVDKREVFRLFVCNYFRQRKETNALLQSSHHISLELKADSRGFPLEPSSNVEKSHMSPRVPRLVLDAELYWLIRIYDEIYDLRSPFEICIHTLYDSENFNMSVANKILSLPKKLEQLSKDAKSFRFPQELHAIQHRPNLPERFSQDAFDSISNTYYACEGLRS